MVAHGRGGCAFTCAPINCWLHSLAMAAAAFVVHSLNVNGGFLCLQLPFAQESPDKDIRYVQSLIDATKEEGKLPKMIKILSECSSDWDTKTDDRGFTLLHDSALVCHNVLLLLLLLLFTATVMLVCCCCCLS